MKKYPLLTASGLLITLCGIILWQMQGYTQGVFSYPLDDTFIHMSIAKNLALNGTWGINAGTFSSTSSSPLYTLLLALFFKAGWFPDMLPFCLNLLFGLLTLHAANRLLAYCGIADGHRLWILTAAVLLTPIPVLVFSGMEHMLHCWIVLLLLLHTLQLLAGNGNIKKAATVAILGALAVMARFESLFLAGAIVLLLVYYRHWIKAGLLLLVSLLPVSLFGWWSIQQGGYFFPNSVLLKGSNLSGGVQQLKASAQEILVFKLMYGNNTLANLFNPKFAPTGASSLSGTTLLRLIILLPVLALFTGSQKDAASPLRKVQHLAFIVLTGAVMHLAFASVGWLYRYEAYLLLLGILTAGAFAALQYQHIKNWFSAQWLPGKFMLALLTFFIATPFLLRAVSAGAMLLPASRNIYEQQYQMGAFLRQHYHHTSIAVNDIGAVSYYGNNQIIDLWGLGDNEVAGNRLRHAYTPDYLHQLTQDRHARIAIVYEEWFEPALLNRWTKIATWQISDNVICGGDTVTFYAIDPAEASALRDRLQAFTRQLPARVIVKFYN